MLHVWIGHGAPMNESCRVCEWVMSHIWMSHVAYMEKAMSHMWMRHVAHMNQSCRTYKRVMYTSHVAHMKESCRTYECILSYIWINLRGYLRAWAPFRWLRVCEWVTSGDWGYVVRWLWKWQFPLKMLHTRNPPNRETQIPRYLAVQIQTEMLIERAAAEVL